MTTILDSRQTGDGWDVRFVGSDGQAHVLHWPSQPTEAQVTEAIAAFEAGLEPDTYVIVGEDE
jgi:hypothetical protein